MEILEPLVMLTSDMPGDALSWARTVHLASGESRTLGEEIGHDLARSNQASHRDGQTMGEGEGGGVQITITNATVLEGQWASFQVTLSEPRAEVTELYFSTSDGSAQGDWSGGTWADFRHSTGNIVFGPQQTVATVSIETFSDLQLEGDEQFSLYVSDTSANYGFGTVMATGTIQNDVSTTPDVSVGNVSALEGQPMVFTVILAHASSLAVPVYYSTSDGSASGSPPGSTWGDFHHVAEVLNFAPGETVKTASVETLQDLDAEGDEQFSLGLSTPWNSFVPAVGTIRNDLSTTPSVVVSNVTVAPGQSAVFTITLGSPAVLPFVAFYSTQDGSALGSNDPQYGDYLPTSGSVAFAAGDTSQSFTVDTYPNSADEGAETFQVNAYVSWASSSATGTIAVESPPVLSPIGDQIVPEETTLSLTASATSPHQVTYSLGGPDGMIIDPNTGAITWTPTEAQGPGTYTVVVTASDDSTPRRSDSKSFQIQVTEVNRPPVLYPIGNRIVPVGSSLNIAAVASDPDLPANALTYVLSGPEGATMDQQSGVFTWTPQDAGTYTVSITVTDDGSPPLSASGSVQIAVVSGAGGGCAGWDDPVPQEILGQEANPLRLERSIPIGASCLRAAVHGAFYEWASPRDSGGQELLTGVVRFEWASGGSGQPAPSGVPEHFDYDAENDAFSDNFGHIYQTLVALDRFPAARDGYLAWATDGNGRFVGLGQLTDRWGGDALGEWYFIEYINVADYQVRVSWGDATPSEAGNLEFVFENYSNWFDHYVWPDINNAGELRVSTAEHTYLEPGQYHVAFEIVNPNYGQGHPTGVWGASVRPHAELADPVLGPMLRGTNAPFILELDPEVANIADAEMWVNGAPLGPITKGVEFNKQVGAFGDNDPLGSTYTYQAIIDWGDGSSDVITVTPQDTQGSWGWTYGFVNGRHTYQQLGSYQVSVRVNAPDGTTRLGDPVTVYVTAAPVLEPIGDKTVFEQSQLTFTATAADEDLPADRLTYSLDGAAPGMAIDEQTGLFTWTPMEDQGPGTYVLTIWVTDIRGLSDSETIQVVVNEDNQPPVLTGIGDRTVAELTTLAFTVSGTDPDFPSQTLSFSADNDKLPPGASFNTETRQFSWTPDESQGPGTYTVTFSVSDGIALASQAITVTVTEVNSSPVLAPIGDWTVPQGSTLTFTVSASDADEPANPLTYSVSGPAGVTIDAATGVFTWTPGESLGLDSYPVTFSVTDGIATASQVIAITITEVNTPPVLPPIGDQTVPELATLSFLVSASDADEPANLLTYSVSGPAGVSIGATTGVFSWTPDESLGPGSYAVTLSVTDGVATASETITITVTEVNSSPVLTPLGDRTVPQGSTLSFTVSASDADEPANPLTYSVSGPAGVTIDAESGVFTWTPGASLALDSYPVTFSVTDGVATANQVISITVTEVNHAPVIYDAIFQIGELAARDDFVGTIWAFDPDPGDVLEFDILSVGTPMPFAIAPSNWPAPSVAELRVASTLDYDASPYTLVVRVHDFYRLTDTATVVVNVIDQTAGGLTVFDATFDVPEDAEVGELVGTVLASHPDPTQSLTFRFVPGYDETWFDDVADPTWPESGAGGLHLAQPLDFETLQDPTLTLVVEASDGQRTATGTVTINVIDINEPPVLDPIGDKQFDLGTELRFPLHAEDPDLGDWVTYSLDSDSVLAGMQIEQATHDLVWLPDDDWDPTVLHVTVTATDHGHPARSDSETFHVTLLPGLPVVNISSLTVHEDDGFAWFTVTLSRAANVPITVEYNTVLSGTSAVSGEDFVPVSGTLTFAPGQSARTIAVELIDDTTEEPEESFLIHLSIPDNVPARLPLAPAGSHGQAVIVDDDANWPPRFTSTPGEDAYVGEPFAYQAVATDPNNATDPNHDKLTYSLVSGPANFYVDPDSGEVAWTPSAALAGHYVPVLLQVDDGRFETDRQAFGVYVHPPKTNLAPVFVTQPSQTFTVPDLQAGDALGDVSPPQLLQHLADGQTTTVNVSLTLPPEQVRTADTVLIVDESGSMSEQSWISDMIAQLDVALTAQGIQDNRYAVIGYEVDARHVPPLSLAIYAPDGSRVDDFGKPPRGQEYNKNYVGPTYDYAGLNFNHGVFTVPVTGAYTVVAENAYAPDPTGRTPAPKASLPGELSFELRSTSEVDGRAVETSGLGLRSGTILAGETATVSFTAPSGKRLYVYPIAVPGDSDMLLAPPGQQPPPEGQQPQPLALQYTLADASQAALVLPRTGTYQWSLQNTGSVPQSYAIRLADLDPAASSPLSPGQDVSGDISEPYGIQVFRLDGHRGQRVYLEALPSGSGTAGLPWSADLIAPSGRSLWSQGDEQNGPRPTVLQGGGPYVLVIKSHQVEPVQYGLRLHDLSASGPLLSDGTDLEVDLQSPSSERWLRFAGQRGQHVRLTVDAPYAPQTATWQVFDPFGVPLFEEPTGIASEPTQDLWLRADGNYSLLLTRATTPSDPGPASVRIDRFDTESIPDHAGTAVSLGQRISGNSTTGGAALEYVFSGVAGQQLIVDGLVDMDSEVRVRITAPSGNTVYHDLLSWSSRAGYGWNASRPLLTSSPLVLLESGVYQVTVYDPSGQATPFAFELHDAASASTLDVNAPNHVTLDRLSDARIFRFDAQAGQEITLDKRDVWGDADAAPEIANWLRVPGSHEDGYVGLQHGLNNLQFRPGAAVNFLLLTDEQREVENETTCASLFGQFFAAGIGLHAVVNAQYRDSRDLSALGLTGFGADDTAYFANGQGSYSTRVGSDVELVNAAGTTREDYVDLADALDGTSWDITKLRRMDPNEPSEVVALRRQSFAQAFAAALVGHINDQLIELVPSVPDAPVTIGPPVGAGRTITFPVTFTGDGDAWNFDLEFHDNRASQVVLGSIPVAVGGGYRYDAWAVDPDEEPVTFHLTDPQQPGASVDEHKGTLLWSPPGPGQYPFGLHADDPHGASDRQDWTVTVTTATNPNQPPDLADPGDRQWEPLQPHELQLSATDLDQDTLTYQLLPGAPAGLTLDRATGLLTWTPTREQADQTHAVIVRVVDGRGGRDLETFQIQVLPVPPVGSQGPVFDNLPRRWAISGIPYDEPVLVRDPDGDSSQITLALLVAPSGMEVKRQGNVWHVRWAPRTPDDYSVTLEATDSSGLTATLQYPIRVYANLADDDGGGDDGGGGDDDDSDMGRNHAPELTSELNNPPNPIVLDYEWTWPLRAEDPEGDAITLELAAKPDGMTLDDANVIHWTPHALGLYHVTIVARDDRGAWGQWQIGLPVNINLPPGFLSEPVRKAALGRRYEYRVEIGDEVLPNGGGDLVTLTLDAASEQRGMRLANRVLTWTPQHEGRYEVILTASDPWDGVAVQKFELQVVAPAAPKFTSTPPNLRAWVGHEWVYVLQAEDADDETLTFSLVAGAHPDNMRLYPHPNTPQGPKYIVRWTPTSAEPDQVSVTVAVADPWGNLQTQSFELSVLEGDPGILPPNVSSVPKGPAYVGYEWTYQITTLEPPGPQRSYHLRSAPTGNLGMTVNAQGLVRWVPTEPGNYEVEIEVSDGGLPTVHTFTMPVRPINNVPIIYGIPYGPAFVGHPWRYQIVGYDADGDYLTYAITNPPNGFTLDADNVVTWTPTVFDVGERTDVLTIRASDADGGSWDEIISLSVLQVPPLGSPVVTSGPPGLPVVGRPWKFQLRAVDPDGVNTVVFEDDGSTLPGVEVAEDGTVTFQPLPEHLGQAYDLKVLAIEREPDGDLTTEVTHFAINAMSVLKQNHPPVIDSQPTQQQAYLNSPTPWTYQVLATDPDRDDQEDLHYALDPASLAAGFVIDEATGVITWTPTDPAVKAHTVLVTVRDGTLVDPIQPDSSVVTEPADFDTQVFTVTVAGGAGAGLPTAPQITSLPPATALLGSAYQYSIRAQGSDDPNGTALTYEVHAANNTVPDSDLHLDGQHTLTWTPSEPGYHTLIVTVTDPGNGLATTQEFLVAVIEPYYLEEPPEFITPPPGPTPRDVPLEYLVQARDPNGDQLTFELDQASLDRGLTLLPLPVGEGGGEGSGRLLTWTPHQAGVYPVVITVSDGVFTVEQDFTLLVLSNAPPRIDSAPVTHATIGQLYTYTVQATDPNAEDVASLEYDLEDAPVGMGFVPDSNHITWTPTADQLGRHAVRVVVTDQHDARAVQSFLVQALLANENHAPLIRSVPRSTVPAGRGYAHQVVATDRDGDDLVFELRTGPAGMEMDPLGLITWTPTQAQVSELPHSFTVRVTSPRDRLFDEETFLITVTADVQNSAPQITSTPRRSATVGYTYVYQPSATDLDPDVLVWDLVQGPRDMHIDPLTGRTTWAPSLADVGTRNVKVRVRDLYGGQDEQTWTITTRDANLAPVFDSSPPELAAIGEPLTYLVQTHDPDEGEVHYALVAADGSSVTILPNRAAIDAASGLVTWTPTAEYLGLQPLTVRAIDDRGASTDQWFEILVYDPALNRPPVVSFTAPRFLVVGQTMNSLVTAIDPPPFERPLAYWLVNPLPGMRLDATHHVIWTATAEQVGPQTVTVAVSDSHLTTRQSSVVAVRTNAAPNLPDVLNQLVTAGQTFNLAIPATDADGDPLFYDLSVVGSDPLPNPLPSIDQTGRIRWATGPALIGTYTLQARVRDLFVAPGADGPAASDFLGLSDTATFTVTIEADIQPPQVAIEYTAPAVVGQDIWVTVRATDNVGVQNVTLIERHAVGQDTVTQTVTLDAAGRGKFRVDVVGPSDLVATATDAVGNSGSQTLTIDVVADPDPPHLELTRPTDNQVITEPVGILGTIDDALDHLADWSLTLRGVGGPPATVAGSGSTDPAPRIIATGTTEIISGLLATFDPTLLDNGVYELTLTATDSVGNTASLTRTVELQGQLKPGSFNLSFTDLEIPAPGIPIKVSRTYSTLRADRLLDFGYGWSLDFGRPKLQIDYPDPEQSLYNNYVPFRDGTRVVITLPDGSTQGFTFQPQLIINNGFGFGIGTNYRPFFLPDPGVTSWLTVDPVDLLKATDEYLLNGFAYNPVAGFERSDFTLYLASGERYGMSPDGQSAWIDDRHGNRLTYTDRGISHSNGRSVAFARDEEGRITAVTDPAGNRILYTYDPQTGDLVAVTDRTGATTHFTYVTLLPSPPGGEGGVRGHFLSDAIDALGRTAAHVTYDAQGRISEATDATQAKTKYNYNPGTRVQEVEDPSGASVSQTLDRRGNVLREVGADGSLIVRTYDSRDRLLSERIVVGQEDTLANGEHDDQVTRYSYNTLGQPVTTTDARGQRTRNSYDQYGQLLSSTDPLGNTTQSEYDPVGNLTKLIASGRATQFAYDAAGNVTEAKDDAGNVLVRNKYDDFGQLLESTPAAGPTTYMGYDANGNRRYSWRIETIDGVKHRIIDRTDYDAADRAIGTAQLVVPMAAGELDNVLPANIGSATPRWTTHTKYNAVGQVERSLDRFGNATETTYDKRGLSVQTRTLTRSVSEAGTAGSVDRWLVTRTVHDPNGRAILTTDSFVEASSVTAANGAAFDPLTETYSTFLFDNTTAARATYSLYNVAGRVIKTVQLKNVVVEITGQAPNYETRIRVGSQVYDPTGGVTLEEFFQTAGAIVSSTTTEYGAQGRVEKTVNPYGGETRTTYNRFGDVIQTATQAKDENSSLAWLVTRTVYDDRGRVEFTLDQVAVSDPTTEELSGFGTHPVYDERGRVTKTERVQNLTLKLANGDTTVTSQGQFVSETKTIYNGKGQVARTTAADGQVTDYEYDELGRQKATIGHAVPAESVGLTQYAGKLVRSVTKTEYDAAGRVWREWTNLVQVEQGGAVIHRDDTTAPNARKTEYAYDAFGNRVKTTFADGSFVLVRYDDFGRQVAESRQMPASLTVAWDDQQKSFVVQSGTAEGFEPGDAVPTKLFEYDTQGRLAAVALPAVPDPQALDGQGQPKVKRPRYVYGYDARGNQTLIRDALGRETWFTFDTQGHQLTRTLPLGVGQAFQPDAQGNIPDQLPFPTTDTARLPFTEYFAYNDLGQQTLHVSFEGVVTQFQYDTDDGADVGDTGRLVAKRYFQTLAGYQTWRADQDDGAPFTVNPDELWTYTYDAFGQQTNVAISLREMSSGDLVPHRTETTDHDAQGRTITVTSPEGTIHYEYDPVSGRQTRTLATTLVGEQTSLITVTDTHYPYDALGRLDAAEVHARNGQTLTPPEVTDYVYDLIGNLDEVWLVGDVIADYQYDELNRLELLRHFRDENANGTYEATVDTLLAQFDYELLADSRRAGVIETISDGATTTVNDIDWFYDAIGRLSREVYDGPGSETDFATDYLFDLVGNRLEKATDTDPNWASLAAGNPPSPNEKVTSTYDANDRLLTEIALSLDGTSWITDQTTWHEYDPDADQLPGTGGSSTMETRKTVFQGADTDPATRIILSDAKYSYNLQNRLAKAVIDSDGDGPAAPATVEYGYDAAGIRVKKVEGTDKVLYLVDHHNPTGYAQVLAEIAVAQQVQQLVRLYTLGLDVISQADAAGAVYHLLYDGHGSTRALLNGAGYVIAGQTFAYDAYGNAIGFNPAAALTTFLYSGEQFDQRLQMQYLRARYYDLATGRFNRLDPFFGNLRDPLSLHKSQYAHADPISGIDPRGEFVGSVLGLGLGVMWALSARSKYDASVLSIGSWVGSAVRVLAGYYGTHIAIMSLQAGWTWLRAPVSLTGFHGKIDPNLRWYYVTIVWSRLIQPVAQHYLNGGTAAEYNAGSAGANAIANAYVDYVLQQTDEDSWLAQYLPAWAANFVGGTKCKAWAMGLSTALTGPANPSNGWKVKAHYNSNPFWFDYFLAPNEEAGIHNWFQPAYAHHSFLSLTYHEKPLPNGKVSRPDFVLDPWATRLPDVYDAVNFHKYWPLNQHDPLTGMGNSNIDMGTPSNPT